MIGLETELELNQDFTNFKLIDSIKESEFNLSYNPSLVTGSYASGSLRNFATGSDFTPYVTTVGLYNDTNELLMVAKLGKPIMISPDTDMTFIVKYDT